MQPEGWNHARKKASKIFICKNGQFFKLLLILRGFYIMHSDSPHLSVSLHLLYAPASPCPPIKTKFKRKANNQPTKTNKQNYHHTMDSFRVKVKTRISHPCKRTEKTSTLTIKMYPFWLNCPHAPLPTLWPFLKLPLATFFLFCLASILLFSILWDPVSLYLISFTLLQYIKSVQRLNFYSSSTTTK